MYTVHVGKRGVGKDRPLREATGGRAGPDPEPVFAHA